MSASVPLTRVRSSAFVLATRNRPCICCLARRSYATNSSTTQTSSKPSESSGTRRKSNIYKSPEDRKNPRERLGTFAENTLSIAAAGRDATSPSVDDRVMTQSETAKQFAEAISALNPQQRDKVTMAVKLNPHPHLQRQWERKKVIQSIRRRGRLSKKEVIKRTERELVSKSKYWKTSMKRLAPLARQIAGKTIEDAKAQMRFSKKKYAKVILDHLEEAELKAVVERGMTLREPQGRRQIEAPERKTGEEKAKASEAAAKNDPKAKTGPPPSTQPTKKEERKTKPIVDLDQEENRIMIYPGRRIALKDGTAHTVYDPASLYVDQAWVNKGSYGMKPSGRARGRIDTLRLPQTSITVLLKEERTRVREHTDRQERDAKKKVWVQLPDRPIQGQRSYYCW